MKPINLNFKTIEILSTRIAAVNLNEAMKLMEHYIEVGASGNYFTLTGMAGIMEARRNPVYKKVMENATIAFPDGFPVVLLSRLKGVHLSERVSGPDLMHRFFSSTGAKYRHFLYGGTEEVCLKLKHILEKSFNADIVGFISPPFRTLTQEEQAEAIDKINKSRVDVLWVGIGSPKQDIWMHDLKDSLRLPVMLGVGAAFDFLSGNKKRAPRWMQNSGLEWLHRLCSEPKRLWKRYILQGGHFVFLCLIEYFHSKFRRDE